MVSKEKEHFWIGQLSVYVRPKVRMFHVNYVPRDQFFAGSQRCEAIGLGSVQNDRAVHADETFMILSSHRLLEALSCS